MEHTLRRGSSRVRAYAAASCADVTLKPNKLKIMRTASRVHTTSQKYSEIAIWKNTASHSKTQNYVWTPTADRP